MPKKIKINTQECREREFWRLSYKADQSYKMGVDSYGAPILWSTQKEEQIDYAQRRNRAVVEPEVRPVVDKYLGFATRTKPSRPLEPPWYTAFLSNANAKGCSFDAILAQGLKTALIEQSAYFYVNMIEDAAAVKCLSGDAILAFTQEEGMLTEVWLYLGERSALYLNATYAQVLEIAKETDGSYTILKEGPAKSHPYGKVPLVCLKPGVDFTPGIAEMQKQIFNYESLLNQNVFNATFNHLVVKAEDPSSYKDQENQDGEMRIGTKSVSVIGSKDDMKWLAPDKSVIETINNLIATKRAAIDRFSGLGSTNPNDVESGLAKSFRFDETNVRVVAILKNLEKAENDICYLVAKGLGQTPIDPVVYPEDVNLPDKDKEFDRTDKICSSSNIPPIIKKKELEDFASYYGLDSDQQKQLHAEIEELLYKEDGEDTEEVEEEDAIDPAPATMRLTLRRGQRLANHTHEVEIGTDGVYTSSTVNGHNHKVRVKGEVVTRVEEAAGHTHAWEELT